MDYNWDLKVKCKNIIYIIKILYFININDFVVLSNNNYTSKIRKEHPCILGTKRILQFVVYNLKHVKSI